MTDRLRQKGGSIGKEIYDPARDGRIEVEGDLAVMRAVIQQAQSVREGKEDTNIRVALFILPGGIRGVAGGAEVTALHDAGMTDGFRVVVGGSTGAHTAAWLLAGNPRLGTSIFYEECTTSSFIDKKRILSGSGMDVGYLSALYRGEVGTKRLDVEQVRHSRPDFRIAVTEYESGKAALLDGKKVPTITAIEASSTAGPLYTRPVMVNDTRYVDASVSAYFPVREIIDAYNPTHILVLANRPQVLRESRLSRIGDCVLSRFLLPAAYRQRWLARLDNLNDSMRALKDAGIPHLIVWSDSSVHVLSQDAEKIRAAADRAEKHMAQLIEQQSM